MGCVVNGPGEAQHADIGISLPGVSEEPRAVVFIRGKKEDLLQGDDIRGQFLAILDRFLEETFPPKA